MLVLFIWLAVALSLAVIGKHRDDNVMLSFGVLMMLVLAMVNDFPT